MDLIKETILLIAQIIGFGLLAGLFLFSMTISFCKLMMLYDFGKWSWRE